MNKYIKIMKDIVSVYHVRDKVQKDKILSKDDVLFERTKNNIRGSNFSILDVNRKRMNFIEITIQNKTNPANYIHLIKKNNKLKLFLVDNEKVDVPFDLEYDEYFNLCMTYNIDMDYEEFKYLGRLASQLNHSVRGKI